MSLPVPNNSNIRRLLLKITDIDADVNKQDIFTTPDSNQTFASDATYPHGNHAFDCFYGTILVPLQLLTIF